MRTFRFRSLLLLLAILSVPVLAAGPARYVVSYLWSRNLSSVETYRDKVAQVLGSEVGDRLEVVTDNGLFGLIYPGNGDSAGAGRVSKAHSRLLRGKGLEASAPIRARAWVVVGGEVSPTVAEARRPVDVVEPAAPSQPSAEIAQPAPAAPEPEPSQTAEGAGSNAAPAVIASTELAKQEPPQQEALQQELTKQELTNQDLTNQDLTKQDLTKQESPKPHSQKKQPEPAKVAAPRKSDLQNALEDYLNALRRQGRIGADERAGWSVYDFTTGEKLVTINEDVQFQAASLIKPFIAAAFFHRVNKRELTYGPRSREHMRAMIQHSSNASADWVMRRVGGPGAVQQILQRNYGSIFRQTAIVEYIPLNGRTYRNKASVHDYSRFLYAVWKGSIPGAEEIKRLMALPGPDRIFKGVEEIPHGTHVYDKTGSTARLCGDMGILSVVGSNGRRYPYTLIGVIEKPGGADNYTAWIRSRSEVIRDVSGIVYRGILDYHGRG